jgi:Na+(H+)/acetate symporter ActP
MFFKNSFPAILQNSINCGAFAMIAGFVIVPVVSIFTKAPDRKFVDETLASCNRPISEI